MILHHMTISPLEFILFFLVGIVAGLVESSSGGSGLVVLPVLLFGGVDPIKALGASKLQYAFGALVSITRYTRANLTVLPYLWLYAFVSVIMGALGAIFLVNARLPFLNFIVPFFLLIAAFYFAKNPHVKDEPSAAHLRPLTFALGPVALIAFYDGFLGTGSGSFYVLALVWGLGLSTLHATACTKIIDFCSGLAALVILIWHDQVLWTQGTLLGLGQMVGAWFGAGIVIRKGTRVLRPLLVVISMSLCLKLLWNALN